MLRRVCHPERFADGERCVPLGLLEGRKAATYLEGICTRPGDTQWAPVTERVE